MEKRHAAVVVVVVEIMMTCLPPLSERGGD
jgi:hypothetical protein